MKKSTYKYATIFTVILCLATLAVAWTSSWFSNWNMADWSKKWETLFGIEQQEPKPDGTDTPGGGDTPQTPVDNDVVAISGKGDKMLAGETYDVTNFAYVCAENSVNKTITLNATVTPDDAVDKSLTWQLSWVNPESDFAKGKAVTDYVSLTPSSDTLSCDVTLIKDFGEQITLNASLQTNNHIKDTIHIDLLQKINSLSFRHFIVKPHNYSSGEQLDCEEGATSQQENRLYNSLLGRDPTKYQASKFYDYEEKFDGYESYTFNNLLMKEYYEILCDISKNYTIEDPALANLQYELTIDLANTATVLNKRNITLNNTKLVKNFNSSNLTNNILEFTPYEYTSYTGNLGYKNSQKYFFDYNTVNPYKVITNFEMIPNQIVVTLVAKGIKLGEIEYKTSFKITPGMFNKSATNVDINNPGIVL